MLFTKGKGAADSVDELKKQASAAAVAKAVEVIKAGGTQAEAAAAAKGVAREILARGQQQINQKPPMQTKKAGKKGLMGRLRKNKKNKAASAEEAPPTEQTTSALPSTAHLSSTDSKSGTMSPDPEPCTTGSMTGSRPEPESSGDAASKANSKSPSKASKETSSTPLLYLEASLGGNEDISLITDTNASRSTIHVTDLLKMGGVMKMIDKDLLNMGRVMDAIDKALDEQDVKREEIMGETKHWMDRLLDCEMCFAPEGEGEDEDNSLIDNGPSNDGDGKDNPSVLSGSAGKGSNALETAEEAKESSSAEAKQVPSTTAISTTSLDLENANDSIAPSLLPSNVLPSDSNTLSVSHSNVSTASSGEIPTSSSSQIVQQVGTASSCSYSPCFLSGKQDGLGPCSTKGCTRQAHQCCQIGYRTTRQASECSNNIMPSRRCQACEDEYLSESNVESIGINNLGLQSNDSNAVMSSADTKIKHSDSDADSDSSPRGVESALE
mmetsp:Transcript_11785/g.23681  ORF Transcript_11785/g.23681 Transcript_11785/m.23681 type:complete len:496 (+) Transcript_11785:199-1686(+)